MAVLLESGAARVEVLPERGALVTRFSVGGEDVLFMDPTTLADSSRSVRGGIPLLFPIAGKLVEDRFAVEGRTYSMPQHGFARRQPWRVGERQEDFASLSLASSDDTLRQFPWKFECTLDLRLEPERLTLAWTTRNQDERPLPLHLGFHPYLFVPEGVKAQARVETRATRAYDNQRGTTGTLEGIDLTGREVDLHLLDHGSTRTVLHRGPSLRPIHLTWSPELATLVVWTLAGRDFVCVEPWTGLGGALSRGEPLPLVRPGEAKALTFTLGV